MLIFFTKSNCLLTINAIFYKYCWRYYYFYLCWRYYSTVSMMILLKKWIGVGSGFWILVLRKNQFASCECSNNYGAMDVKMNGSSFVEKSSFSILQLLFSSESESGSYTLSIAKTALKKIRVLSCRMKFLSFEVSLFLFSLFSDLEWNTIMFGLVLPITNWVCWIRYRNRWYIKLLALRFGHLLNN